MNTLVSFTVCPYVQRSIIVLEEKNIRDEFSIQYINLNNKPDWFLRYSPMGKVPILIVGDTVLFESATINEYLDEVYIGRKLLPRDPLRRAHNRAWIEFISSLLVLRNQMQHAASEQETRALARQINQQLTQLEKQLAEGPFFNGREFSLVDAAAAPLFQRLHWLLELAPDLPLFDGLPKVQTWKDTLLQHESVIRATDTNLHASYLGYLQQQSYERGDRAPGWLAYLASASSPLLKSG